MLGQQLPRESENTEKKTHLDVQNFAIDPQVHRILFQGDSIRIISGGECPRLQYFALILTELLIRFAINAQSVFIGQATSRVYVDLTLVLADSERLMSNKLEHPVLAENLLAVDSYDTTSARCTMLKLNYVFAIG